MHILSQGIPMTSGEVYALLRRRRDERSAAAHLPFGLQRSQADPHSRTSAQMVQYTKSNYGGPQGGGKGTSDGSLRRQSVATATGGGGGGGSDLLPPTAADVEAMNSLLASPAAGHLAVLLTEVRVLHYLAQHVVMAGSAQASASTMKALYGPSTVYDLTTAEDESPSEETVSSTEDTARAVKTEDDEHASASSSFENEASECAAVEQLMKDAITHTLVGTKSHVRCVGAALAYYESKGRRQERAFAKGLAAVVADLRRSGYWPPTGTHSSTTRSTNGNGDSVVETRVKTEMHDDDDGEEEKEEEEVFQRSSALAQKSAFYAPSSTLVSGSGGGGNAPSPLLSRPPNLVDMVAFDGGLSAAASPPKMSKMSTVSPLSDSEAMALVVARPTDRLQVHQLLDRLDERFGGDEAAVAYFVEQIVKVFRSPQQ